MSIQPHEQRVIDEKKELEGRLIALNKFIDGDKPNFVTSEQWELLHEQAEHMYNYYLVLEKRIKLFGANQ